MASSINASTAGAGGVITTADNSGVLNVQTAGTTALTITNAQNLLVNTATSSAKLTVVNSGDAISAKTLVNNDYSAFIAYNLSDAVTFTVSGAGAITAAGNVLIGSPGVTTARVSAKSSTSNTASFAVYYQNSSSTELGYIRSDGLTASGTAANSPYNFVTGLGANMLVDSNGLIYRATSSLKYKHDVQDAPYGLADVLKLRPVTYKSKNNGDLVLGGLIAEEVDAAGLTEFVQYADDGTPDALSYGNMVSLAFAAIQELNAKVEAQAAEIASLKAGK